MELSATANIGNYRLVSPLGEGGMGVVWTAIDSRLGREVALKFLPDDFAGRAGELQRFRREARALASLNHPGIVTIHAIEECEGRCFIAMELVHGRTLDAIIGGGFLDAEQAARIRGQYESAAESGAVPSSFDFRGPDNIAGVTYALWIDSPSNWRMIAGAWEGLWETTDGGFHWRLIPQFEHYRFFTIVQSPAAPDVLYAGTGRSFSEFSTGILKSGDRGATWNVMEGSTDLHSGVQVWLQGPLGRPRRRPRSWT